MNVKLFINQPTFIFILYHTVCSLSRKKLNWVTILFLKLPTANKLVVAPSLKAFAIKTGGHPCTTSVVVTNFWLVISWCLIIPTRRIIISQVYVTPSN
jgi:hypothetical protein